MAFDLGRVIQNPDYAVAAEVKKKEDLDERTARLAREKADAAHERWRATITFGAVLAGVAAVAGLCLYLAGRDGGSPDDRKWAMAVLASIVSAGVGFLTGKQQGR